MSFLVDTNVLSEPARRRPDPRVVAWLRAHEAELYVSAVTLGELRRGVERLPAGPRQGQLRAWLTALGETMRGRVLSFNVSTAHVWGQLKARWDAAGITVSSLGSQIAATAQRHGLTLVTRNTDDFARTGAKLLNPFA